MQDSGFEHQSMKQNTTKGDKEEEEEQCLSYEKEKKITKGRDEPG